MSNSIIFKSVKHIWWDLDDTLYPYSENYHNEKNSELIKEYAKLKNMSVNEAATNYTRDLNKYNSTSNLFSSVFSKPLVYSQKILNRIDRRKYITYNSELPQIFFDLQIRNPKIKHSIISNSTLDQIILSLKILRLKGSIFENIISSSEMGYPKPKKECFLEIIKVSNIPPNEILYIGDREKVDIIPAKNVGIKTVLLTNDDKQTIADAKINSIGEIVTLL